jgi:hypothetical protein
MKIYFYFAGSRTVPLDIFEGALEKVRTIVSAIERAEIARIRSELPELPARTVRQTLAAFDAEGADSRLIRVSAVRPGSVELAIVLTAFGYWLLDKTLGTTVESAWEKTELNRKIRKILLAGKKEKLEAITRQVNKPNVIRIEDARRRLEVESVEIPMFARLDKEREEIRIRINPPEGESEEDGPPTWDQIV